MSKHLLHSAIAFLWLWPVGCSVWQPVDSVIGPPASSPLPSETSPGTKELLETGGDPVQLLRLATNFEGRGETDRARQIYQLVLTRDVDNQVARARLAHLDAQAQAAKNALASKPDRPDPARRATTRRSPFSTRIGPPIDVSNRPRKTTQPRSTVTADSLRPSSADSDGSRKTRSSAYSLAETSVENHKSSGSSLPHGNPQRGEIPDGTEKLQSSSDHRQQPSARVKQVTLIGLTEDRTGQQRALLRLANGGITTVRVGDVLALTDSDQLVRARVLHLETTGIQLEIPGRGKVWYR
tara:strand:- start:672 stop:1559 length:888 start_codon:yes stop_codon:yes gene_type:complete